MRISLFITCLANAFYPDIGTNMVKILRRLGHRIDVPQTQTCCGQIAFNSGYVSEAREVARVLVDAFAESEYVVSPSGSCISMIHDYYPYLFKDEPAYLAKAQLLVSKSYEFSQFIVNVLQVPDLGARYTAKAAFHPSCHAYRLLGLTNEPSLLMQNVQGLELVPIPEEQLCCGFGGTFSIKMPEISEAIVQEKAQHIIESGADLLLGIDMGCLMNIQGYLEKSGHPIPTMHLIQLLGKGME